MISLANFNSGAGRVAASSPGNQNRAEAGLDLSQALDALSSVTSAFSGVDQRIEQWVRTQPTLSLAIAASVGAGLGWLIKVRH